MPWRSMLASLLGGVGLFLLGMALMTDGLQAAAGDHLAAMLARATKRPLAAVGSGALVTALVQSSSATTVVVLGFVGAGVLGLTEAVGVIFGSNLGTTATAWLVSTVGLHLDVGAVALPGIGVGALIRLFGRDRAAHLGVALSGFALVFLGIDVLQTGMAELASQIDVAQFVGSSLGSRVVLVVLGLVMTVLMQSSSAAVATTLTAVHAGTLDIPQAAALVIGQNIGTTVTALMGAIGGDTTAKRVAAAHVMFNVLTGVIAFVGLPFFLWIVDSMAGGASASVQLAAFHSAFNVVGVLVLLPAIHPFVRLVRRIVPERPVALAHHLLKLPKMPAARLGAVRRTTQEVLFALVAAVQALLLERDEEAEAALDEVDQALELARSAVALPGRVALSKGDRRAFVGLLHCLDHVESLAEACREPAVRHARAERLEGPRRELGRVLMAAERWQPGAETANEVEELAAGSAALAEARRATRGLMLESAADGELSPSEIPALLDGLHWLDRVGYHVWRAAEHIVEARGGEARPRTSRTPAPQTTPPPS